MRIRNVVIDVAVYRKISRITDVVTDLTSHTNAIKYGATLLGEIMQLSYLADIVKESRYISVKMIHPHAKHIVTKNRKWAIVFHTEDDMVVVDSILLASTIRF